MLITGILLTIVVCLVLGLAIDYYTSKAINKLLDKEN